MKEEEEQQTVSVMKESCPLAFILLCILLSNSLSLTMNHQTDSQEEKLPDSHCINNTDYSFPLYFNNCSLFYLGGKWKKQNIFSHLVVFWLLYWAMSPWLWIWRKHKFYVQKISKQKNGRKSHSLKIAKCFISIFLTHLLWQILIRREWSRTF